MQAATASSPADPRRRSLISALVRRLVLRSLRPILESQSQQTTAPPPPPPAAAATDSAALSGVEPAASSASATAAASSPPTRTRSSSEWVQVAIQLLGAVGSMPVEAALTNPGQYHLVGNAKLLEFLYSVRLSRLSCRLYSKN